MGMLTVIEPIPEAVEPILYKVFGGSKVEPWVDCSVVSFFLASSICIVLKGLGGCSRGRTLVNDALES
jgi:hypothetical protein